MSFVKIQINKLSDTWVRSSNIRLRLCMANVSHIGPHLDLVSLRGSCMCECSFASLHGFRICSYARHLWNSLRKHHKASVMLSLEAGGTSLGGVWIQVCGRRVTEGWSDHAVNSCELRFQGAELRKSHKPPIADGMDRGVGGGVLARGHRCWLIGWFGGIMADAGVQVFVDRMTLVHRRIVGRWICHWTGPQPFSIVMPAGMFEGASNPDRFSRATKTERFYKSSKETEHKHITRCFSAPDLPRTRASTATPTPPSKHTYEGFTPSD